MIKLNSNVISEKLKLAKKSIITDIGIRYQIDSMTTLNWVQTDAVIIDSIIQLDPVLDNSVSTYLRN